MPVTLRAEITMHESRQATQNHIQRYFLHKQKWELEKQTEHYSSSPSMARTSFA